MISEKIKSLLPAEWPVTIGDLPAPNVEAIGILEYDGAISTEYFGPQKGSSVFSPIVKIVLRSKSYPDAKAKVETIQSTLHRHHDETFMSIMLVGAPLYLGRNDQKFHEFQIVFRTQVKE